MTEFNLPSCYFIFIQSILFQKVSFRCTAMVRQHQRLNGHECEQTPEDSGGKRTLVCRSPRDCQELDTTQQLNKTSTDV